MIRAVLLAACLTGCAHVAGPGPALNVPPFMDANDRAITNASAHVGWALAVPLVGERIGGRKGLWISGLAWVALTLAQEQWLHAPAQPDPFYPSEVRTDLVTRILPTLALLAWDLLR